MDDFAKAVISNDDESFVVECLGILGNLSLPDLDYSQILHNHNMIPYIRNVLVPGEFEIDFIECSIVTKTPLQEKPKTT